MVDLLVLDGKDSPDRDANTGQVLALEYIPDQYVLNMNHQYHPIKSE